MTRLYQKERTEELTEIMVGIGWAWGSLQTASRSRSKEETTPSSASRSEAKRGRHGWKLADVLQRNRADPGACRAPHAGWTPARLCRSRQQHPQRWRTPASREPPRSRAATEAAPHNPPAAGRCRTPDPEPTRSTRGACCGSPARGRGSSTARQGCTCVWRMGASLLGQCAAPRAAAGIQRFRLRSFRDVSRIPAPQGVSARFRAGTATWSPALRTTRNACHSPRIMDDTVRRLVTLCEILAEHTGRSISTVSRHATGSGETIARLRRGRAITTRRADRALRFLSEHWPEALPWPGDTP